VKKENFKISIIIPFYNRAEFLIETLNSILEQSYKNIEVLVVDDDSNEENFNKAKRFIKILGDSRFQLLKKPYTYPKGANGSRRYGFHQSSGTFIKWFDSDDIMLPDFLQIQIDSVLNYDLDGVFANCGIYDEDFGQKIRNSWKPLIYSENVLRDYLKTRLAWQTGSGLWNRDSISRSFEPFQQDISNGQEWIFHLFVLTSGLKIGVLDKELYKVRSHSNSISLGYKQSNYNNYIKNRFIARTIGLSRLIETGNGPKRTLIKSMVSMIKKLSIRELPELLRILFNQLEIKYFPTPTSQLVKILNK
jgi:glycosyltransferase involved in cell wall biosynthesis